ncbi:MAG: hypothetical protein HYX37_04170 [Rhizobiales bacterium]|nr:hypothetical protein [Hyphomicrobiales bacterium]
MLAPKELKRFAIGFIQGSSADYSSAQQWIDAAIGQLNVTEKRALKKYLDDLLAGNPAEAMLQRIWNDTPADYYMTAHGSVRGFFKMISETIARQLSR